MPSSKDELSDKEMAACHKRFDKRVNNSFDAFPLPVAFALWTERKDAYGKIFLTERKNEKRTGYVVRRVFFSGEGPCSFCVGHRKGNWRRKGA